MTVKFPTGDRLVIRVRAGRIETKHEASLIGLLADTVADSAAAAGLKAPKIDNVFARVEGPVVDLNRAIAASGREVDSVWRAPDGSITITLRTR